jgi:hypothetical protein
MHFVHEGKNVSHRCMCTHTHNREYPCLNQRECIAVVHHLCLSLSCFSHEWWPAGKGGSKGWVARCSCLLCIGWFSIWLLLTQPCSDILLRIERVKSGATSLTFLRRRDGSPDWGEWRRCVFVSHLRSWLVGNSCEGSDSNRHKPANGFCPGFPLLLLESVISFWPPMSKGTWGRKSAWYAHVICGVTRMRVCEKPKRKEENMN